MKKFLLFTLFFVFLIYSFSLNREWQLFDEKGMYVDEKLFPMPTHFGEIFEVIKTFAFNYHIDSQNAFYSNVITIRSNLLGAILNIIISYLFQKNIFYYHLLEIFLHLVNTALVFLIFNKLLTNNNYKNLLSCLFTLIWALHPTNVEAVLLGTNWPSLLTYTFCFGFFLFNLRKISKENYEYSFKETLIISALFFLSVLISEYSYTLPLILFFTSLAFSRSIRNSLKLSLPYFLGTLFLIIFYIFKSLGIASIAKSQFINLSLERFFFLTPQIFFHFLKLLFYPKELSLYQSNLVHLASSLFDPYHLFTLIVFLSFLVLPLLIFLLPANKDKKYSIFLIYSFVFSIFPFLHIIPPTYCLIADRYCYFPWFVGLICILKTIRELPLLPKKTFIAFPALIVFVFTTWTFIQIKTWENSFTLYSQAAKCPGDNFYKGKIYSILGYYFHLTGDEEKMKKYLLISINYLNSAIKELEAKKIKSLSSPQSLKDYGLDSNSLLTTCAFAISSSRFDYLKENAHDVLKFYAPYIKDNLASAGNSQIDLYAKLLIKTNQREKALEVLENARKKYPFSPTIIYTLSNFYLKNKDLDKATQIIEEGYKLYPTYSRILLRMIKLSELKNDPLKLAEYEYLLGLRIHSQEAYQKATQLYLSLNKLSHAKRSLDKLLLLDNQNPVTLFLLSKYYYLTNNKALILETLNKAYLACKRTDIEVNPLIYKSILLSLTSFNLSYSNFDAVKKYIMELGNIPDLLTKEEKVYTETLKKSLEKN